MVADGCTDGTPAAVRALAQSPGWARPHPFTSFAGGTSSSQLRCAEQAWGGAAAARNRGLEAARGEIVLFLDDDCLASPGLVEAHLAAHDASHDGPRVVLGQIVPGKARSALASEIAEWWRRHNDRQIGGAADFMALFSGNVSVPRTIAIAAGGFDVQLPYGEDIEFGYRLQQRRLAFVYAPSARVEQRNPKSARALLKDFYRSGRSCINVYGKWPSTLPRLPLSAFGDTTLRLRVARGLLLATAENKLAERCIDRGFLVWAARPGHYARIDRPLFELARSYYFWRGVRSAVPDRRAWRRFASPGVPVLMYHSVAPAAAGEDYDRYTVTPGRFARQMRLLRLLGYRVMPLDKLVACWAAGRLPPARSLALTFDDGYENVRDHAWPVLRRLGYPATLFVVTGQVGGCNEWDASDGRPHKALLGWEDIIYLDSEGLRAEAHSVTHANLTKVPHELAQVEIDMCRHDLEARLRHPVTIFAYPYGEANGDVRAQVEASGYRAAFSAHPGLNSLRTPPFDRPRVEIKGSDNLFVFAFNVWAGDDRVLSRIRRRLSRD